MYSVPNLGIQSHPESTQKMNHLCSGLSANSKPTNPEICNFVVKNKKDPDSESELSAWLEALMVVGGPQ